AIDWEAVAGDGMTFALVKATQGVGYVNPWLARDLDEARAAGLLVGAYHFVTPGDDGKAQGEHVVSALVGQVLDLGVWLDWELDGLADWAIAPLFTAAYDAVTEARPLCGLYGGAAWVARFHAANVPIPHLWYADWTGAEPTQDCMLWQSGHEMVDGIPGVVDVDELLKPRGVDLPTAPKARPAPARVDTRPDEERAEAARTNSPDERDGQGTTPAG
nr:glycoside hydrolase family 25 protein [Acidimicrobiales bacterium]